MNDPVGHRGPDQHLFGSALTVCGQSRSLEGSTLAQQGDKSEKLVGLFTLLASARLPRIFLSLELESARATVICTARHLTANLSDHGL